MCGVISNRRVPANIKSKVYKTAVRAAMLYGLETVGLTKRQEAELEGAELKMLRSSLGVKRLDKVRNGHIRGTAHVAKFGEKVREVRLRWFGHVLRRGVRYIEQKMLRMGLAGGRKRGRHKSRFLDAVKEDMKVVGLTVEDAGDRVKWKCHKKGFLSFPWLWIGSCYF